MPQLAFSLIWLGHCLVPNERPLGLSILFTSFITEELMDRKWKQWSKNQCGRAKPVTHSFSGQELFHSTPVGHHPKSNCRPTHACVPRLLAITPEKRLGSRSRNILVWEQRIVSWSPVMLELSVALSFIHLPLRPILDKKT